MKGALGRDIVSERLRALPQYLKQQLASPLPRLPADLKEKGIVATGVGSSEAAARYAAHLLAERGVRARFQSYSEFYCGKNKENDAGYLMLFTQGLSPNAEIVLGCRHQFGGVILVSSSSVEGQHAAGKPERADRIQQLLEEGATLVRHPMENEYEILPRFIGPVCVMAEVCRMVEALFPGSIPPLDQVPDFFAAMTIPEIDLVERSGFFFSNESLHYAQNLSCKIMETLMVTPPLQMDALTYSHGPFQLDRLNSKVNVVFTGPGDAEKELVERLLPLFEKAGSVHVVESPVPAPLAIFYYEAFLNHLMDSALAGHEVDLIDWPGKGEDGAGYGITGPRGME